MRLSYGQNLQNYSQVPTYEELIEPYKILAKEFYTTYKDSKLTQCQNLIAKKYGFESWQKLTFFMKEVNKALNEIDLTTNEWGFILDCFNGHLMSYPDDKRSLVMNLIDGDRYIFCSGKWFDDMSKVDSMQDTWEPSDSMSKFLDKIESLSEFKAKAVLIKAHLYWDKTLGEAPIEVDFKDFAMQVQTHTKKDKDGKEFEVKSHYRVKR